MPKGEQFKVVINREKQYSIWPAERTNLPGWNSVGRAGTKDECLDYIEEVWTDMRPPDFRRRIEQELIRRLG